MKDFLKQKGIRIDNEIYSSDGRKYRLSELLTDYAKSLQLLQADVSSSSWEIRKTESKLRAVFKMNWDSEKLTKFRKLLGFSQNEFANLIGIHQATLSNYEKGRAIAETETMEKVTLICTEWKENKIKHLESEIEFIRSF